MQEGVNAFLRRQTERSYRDLWKQVEAVPPEIALADRHPNWPEQTWGIGQDGSIAGIVYHVAAWKQLTLPLFAPGGKARSQEEFDCEAAPARDDWPSLVAWLREVGTAWNAAVARLPDEAFAEILEWAGESFTLAEILWHTLAHDIQHAAQLEYLLQKHRADNTSTTAAGGI